MIKLTKGDSPIQLTMELILKLTNEFFDSDKKKSVWNMPWLKEALLKSSHQKCAYCECKLEEESKYLEVEHYEDKNTYPDQVVRWNNLLPSCKRCNGNKGMHDVKKEPILNPFIDNPSEHLYFHLYRFNERTNKGKYTVEVLDINNSVKVVLKRFQLGELIQDSLITALEKLGKYQSDPNKRNHNKLKSSVEAILTFCQPQSEYSASCATSLHNSENYFLLKKEMIPMGIWDEQLKELDNNSSLLMLELKP